MCENSVVVVEVRIEHRSDINRERKFKRISLLQMYHIICIPAIVIVYQPFTYHLALLVNVEVHVLM